MWRHSLLALLLGYAVAAIAWLSLYGPGKQTVWVHHLGPLGSGFVFAAALFVALGLWILASVGSGLAIAQDKASRTLPGFVVFVCSTLSTFAAVIVGFYRVL
jgi:hypothetical protein